MAFLESHALLLSPDLDTRSILHYASITLLTFIIYNLIHRRYFSRIKNIPGPFLASFSRLWHLQQIYSGKQNLKLSEQHDKLGKGPDFLPSLS